jgi:hypothetical protein
MLSELEQRAVEMEGQLEVLRVVASVSSVHVSFLDVCVSKKLQMPGGPAGRRVFLSLAGACRRLGLDPKSLVQTGRDFKSPFQSVWFRPRSKPDWPDF